jgi:hypothetical protein
MNRLTLHIGDCSFGIRLSKGFECLPIEEQTSQLNAAYWAILNEIERGAIAELINPAVKANAVA